jgi:branched-chain amino acid transport system permease protein
MEYWATIAIGILSYGVLAVSLNLLYGYIGELSMATGAFFGIGAYVAVFLSLPEAKGVFGLKLTTGVSGLDWNPWLAAIVGIITAGLAAALISIPAVARVRGESLILLTFAFQLVFTQLLTSMQSITGGDQGISGVKPISVFGTNLSSATRAVWLFVILLAAVVALATVLGFSPYGRLLRGIRESESAVMSVGKPIVVPKLLIFSVACAVAGAAGVLQAYYFQSVAPASFNVDLSILIVAAVVLGGAGNIWGALLGAVILGGLSPVLRNFIGDNNASQWQAVIFGLALLAVMALRPNGLIPETVRGRRRSSVPEVVEPTNGASAPPTSPSPVTAAKAPAAGGAPVLVVEGLSKSFGGLQAVSDVSLTLSPGTITALIGPNGAGKTTIFNLITRTLVPDTGQVMLRGKDVSSATPGEIARGGMVRSFQDVRIMQKLSAMDNVALAVPDQMGEWAWPLVVRPRASAKREREVRATARECLKLVGLESSADALVGQMSFGDQKLVAIARLIATGGEVLLLDEPTSGVDAGAVEGVIEAIRRLRDIGKTICLVEHSLHFVEQLADTVIFLDQGKVTAEGSLSELTSRPELAALYFGT